jgi:hypothetical protein
MSLASVMRFMNGWPPSSKPVACLMEMLAVSHRRSPPSLVH